ncbi:class I SAM-dependent RNA methyltransferase [Allorhizobium undicola]|uniref:class I SAM-dependent RNA methyltransferase n=1 Tax=Allorhizobium undicola TaxID=78527 RepID=UPI0004887DE9|nr:class I SAM-dependent RNA methyltransferase [Allorhizobium undicola]
MSTQSVTISSLGAEGDGIAHGPDGPLYVPFSLPGETLAVARVGNQGTIMSITQAAPERVEPKCRHFGPDGVGGTCGGCSLQHMEKSAYNAFKRGLVEAALKARGIDAPVSPLVEASQGQRRRLVYTVRNREKGLIFGFNQPGTHQVVPIEECPITSPAVMARFAALRAICASMAAGSDAFRMTVIETTTGLDVSLDGVRGGLKERERRALSDTVLKLKGIARLSVNGEIVIEPQKPLLDFGGALVCPPPGAFTQATLPAEEAMAALVMAELGKAKKVADLFAGIGTFALRIARKAQVLAVESDEKAVKALDAAARATQGLKPVKAERRDLFRRPLMPFELKGLDAVVFDPPRAGAEAQSAELTKSDVRTLVAVSCNPLTLARDLAILTAGGYRIRSITPIDQFLWSAHVEVVAVLTKG